MARSCKLIVSKSNRHSSSHQPSPPYYNLSREIQLADGKSNSNENCLIIHQILTCCLQVIFSFGAFFVRFDKNDSGNTKAALPIRTNPSKIELIPMDLPGLSLANSHFSISNASIPTYRKRKVSAMKDRVANACLR
jgi:hypothetical protein